MEHLRDFRRGFHLRPLEGFQEARVPCVVSLGNGCRGDFLEDPGAVALPIVPAFEHVGSVRIPRRVFRLRRGLVSGATPRANQ